MLLAVGLSSRISRAIARPNLCDRRLARYAFLAASGLVRAHGAIPAGQRRDRTHLAFDDHARGDRVAEHRRDHLGAEAKLTHEGVQGRAGELDSRSRVEPEEARFAFEEAQECANRARLTPQNVRPNGLYPALDSSGLFRAQFGSARFREFLQRALHKPMRITDGNVEFLGDLAKRAPRQPQIQRLHLKRIGPGWFADLYRSAREGKAGELRAFFVDYRGRPGRDAAWRTEQQGVLSPSGLRHYAPETEEDALAGDLVDAFVDPTWWAACYDASIPTLLKGDRTPLVVGVDAGYRADTSALVSVSRHHQRHDEVAVRLVKTWDPALRGGVVDFDEAERFIRQLCKDYNVVQIAYDPYQLHGMMQRLYYERVAWCKEFPQTADRLKADWDLRDAIINRRIWHANDPVLTEHVTNAGMKSTAEQRSIRIVKMANNRKIDAAVALSMAASRCLYLSL